jgi:PhnB protein
VVKNQKTKVMSKNKAVFTQDRENKKMTVVRSFDASLEQVWKAWTTAEILDQWWAPLPYKNQTKSMDFREGGFWLYSMLSPAGERHYCRFDYETIHPKQSFSGIDMFCDEEGNQNSDFPRMNWKDVFTADGNSTTVTIEITYAKQEDMDTIINMGFEEGFSMGMNQLEELLAKQ